MIPAIQNGKLKIPLKEDSLTSSIFQLLMYLPNNLIEKIFQSIISENLAEQTLGHFENIEFWPKWNSKGTNKKFVEPDILLSFEFIDIIVEAKRFDEKGQYYTQWEKELISYQNEHPSTRKKVILWALGGNKNLDSTTVEVKKESKIESYQIIKTTWINLLTIIKSEYLEYHTLDKEKERKEIIRILKDIIYSFQIHNFFVGDWLNEKGFAPISLRTTSIKYFKQTTKINNYLL